MRRGVTMLTLMPLLVGVHYPGCDPQLQPSVPPEPRRMEELWRAPRDIAARDLLNGPWGLESAPDAWATYRVLRPKATGVNPGVTVLDPHGREWSVKWASHDGSAAEGSIDVVLSRVLSAVGYHQPPVYFLPSFELSDTFGARTESGGRFRLEHPQLQEVGPWTWQQNPFVGTRPYQGLLVILMLFNSSDLKNSSNTLYDHTAESGSVERWYVVRDLGTALGITARFGAERGDVEQLAALRFLSGVPGGYVEFAYAGWRTDLVRKRITADDVRWAGELLGQLTEAQWHDAFRAGGFDRATAGRFIRHLREKVAEGASVQPE